ncbi:uncharacterized protein G2W53_032882 [Senna tora]|uniref:Uncharacterized protein n=1 Tax=Senna tora TaxID=362788 RepID=A0A834T000_9FABA|nr:uncharacterized protein G2W53_032882 [Senna tora]
MAKGEKMAIRKAISNLHHQSLKCRLNTNDSEKEYGDYLQEIDKRSMIRYLWLNYIKLPQESYPSIDLRPEDNAQADKDDTQH